MLIDPAHLASHDLKGDALCDWRFDIATSIPAAREHLPRIHPLTALIAFSDEVTDAEREFEGQLWRPDTEWIALVTPTALQRPALRELLHRAFFDHHTLPINAPRLAMTLGHAHGHAMLSALPHDSHTAGRFGMTGHSPPMLALYRQIALIAPADAPVLIGGESGTGKELVARAIARHSKRAGRAFIAVNCAAIAPALIHSELFGHEKGAFTGAVVRKIGSIEAADQGVLLLDEIGDLPLELQAHLLRFLQERTINRLGSVQSMQVDVRILAATHVDLVRAVRTQRFREDLYYRLNVLSLQVPPLRERSDDVLLLADEVLKRILAKHPSRARGFTAASRLALLQHGWPGNVRELINRIQRAAVMCDARLIEPFDLGLGDAEPSTSPTLDIARAGIERETIERTLQNHRHNITRAARSLGVSRVTLYRLMNRLEIAGHMNNQENKHPESGAHS